MPGETGEVRPERVSLSTLEITMFLSFADRRLGTSGTSPALRTSRGLRGGAKSGSHASPVPPPCILPPPYPPLAICLLASVINLVARVPTEREGGVCVCGGVCVKERALRVRVTLREGGNKVM
jgi:hypothetical protein